MTGTVLRGQLGVVAIATGSFLMLPSTPGDLGCDPEFAKRPQANPPLVNEPALLDPEGALREVRRAYRGLRPSPPTGPIRLLMLVDQDGGIADVKLYRSSNRIEVDSLAMGVVRTFRFSPAEDREGPVCVWLNLPMPGVPL